MSDLENLKEKILILTIAIKHKADYLNPLPISVVTDELGEDNINIELVNYALTALMGVDKIGTTGTGSNLSIVRASK